jgi:hypothetical protein
MSDAPAEETGERTMPFADTLRKINAGRTHAEASTLLQQLVAAVQDTQRKGSITVTITVLPAGNDDQVIIQDTVTTKLPQRDRAKSIFYVTDDYNLVRDDPRQLALPLVSVASPDGQPLKKAE